MNVHVDVDARVPVSVVCVFNNPEVLASCLVRSVESGLGDAPETELIAVDNRDRAFATAGAALNDGARRAKNAVVVFVHQDVVLHSLPLLERAAHLLVTDQGIGILGAVGIDASGRIIGRMRDRVVQIGDSAPVPQDVDSLDEVLFMVTRERILREPLTEDPLLAWHAYGVEYAARMRRGALRAAAMDLAITHNSLTVNLARLDEAHRRVGDLHAELLPIRTTCGTIHRGNGPGGLARALRRRHGAATWWNESLEAQRISRTAAEPVVLADVRLVIDDAVRMGGKTRLRILDAAAAAGAPEGVDGLDRFGTPFVVESTTPGALVGRLRDHDNDEAVLVTGITLDELGALRPPEATPRVFGHWRDIGPWMLVGIDAATLAPLWSETRNKPFAGLVPQRGASS